MSQAREIAEQLRVIREYAKLYPSAHGQIIGQETWRIVLSSESLQWITAAADKLVELEQQLGPLLAALEGLAALVAVAEREACAKACQAVIDGGQYDEYQQYAAAACRDEIRAMSEKGQS